VLLDLAEPTEHRGMLTPRCSPAPARDRASAIALT
jgi:hypothetical protein